MKPKLIVIDSLKGIEELLEYLLDKDFVAFDTETTGVSAHDQVIGYSVCAEESKAYYVILAAWQSSQLTWNPLSTCTMKLLELLKAKQLVMHNGVFDCYMIESNFKIRLIESLHTDTMLAAHILDENRRVGLKELAHSMYGESSTQEQQEMKASIIANGGTTTKDKYELYKADSQLIGRYGAKDALLTYKLFLDLVPELYAQNLDKFFYEDESMPLLRGPTYELNTSGLRVDTEKLLLLKKTLEAECLETKAFVSNEIASKVKHKAKFNIDSPSQLSELLFGLYGLEFSTLTKEGKAVCKALSLKLPYTKLDKRNFISMCESSIGEVYQPEAKINGKIRKAKKIKAPWVYIAADKKTLAKLAPKYIWIQKFLEYKRKTKILTTYVEGIESRVQYGIIQPSFLQHGTTSGRYASRNPNWQNLPRDDQRIKDCIISRPGKVFVSADYSQLEPRVFAYYSGDKRLIEAFNGKSDFYSVVGIDVYDKHDALPLKEGHKDAFGVKYKKLRDSSKTIALARAYGATAYQLAPVMGKSIDDTQRDLDKYDEKFPGVKKMMLEAHDLAKEHGYVTSLFGRPRRIPDAKKITKLYGNTEHADLPYDARKLLNLACNHRIQATGASLVNRAMIAFKNNIDKLGLDCRIVSMVHDEIITECLEADAETVSLLLQDAMEGATILPEVGLEAVPRITRTLAK